MIKLSTFLIFSILSLFNFPNKSVAQDQKYSIDFTVNYINERLDEVNRLAVTKKTIQIEFLKDGKIVRMDDFYADAIDLENSNKYNADNGSIPLKCHAQAKDCIQREIFIRDSKQYHSSTSLKTTCKESDCQSLERAIYHLIMLYSGDKDYTRVKPFNEE